MKTSTMWWVLVSLVACAPAQPCDVKTCQGCCTSTGLCVVGTSLTNCGSGGAVCEACSASERCGLGVCVTTMTSSGQDAGVVDAGVVDAGGVVDASVDAGVRDAGTPDAGGHDAGTMDAGVRDAGVPDAGSCTPRSDVVIAQLYPTGGNSTSAASSKDWIELHNRTGQAVDLSGWALQYAAGTGTSWKVNALPAGTVLAPGATVAVVMGGGSSGGGALPSPNVSIASASDLAGSRGKVALTRNSTALTGNCPTGGAIADFIGYGTTSGTNQVDCFEGASPAPVPASNGAVKRSAGGCTDSDVNGADFVAVTPPSPAGAVVTACPCP